jgi:hypothetical protein
VRRVGDIALLVVQWALVAFGLYLLVVAAHLGVMGILADEGLPVGDHFIVPVYQRLAQALLHGIGALGLGALLFYLRRLYLSRSQ